MITVPKSSGYIYLASPHSHIDYVVRESRFEKACWAANRLMEEGHAVFSPIAHSHSVDKVVGKKRNFGFWINQDAPLLRHADRLVVLVLPGWLDSKGVGYELELARALGMPISFIENEN